MEITAPCYTTNESTPVSGSNILQMCSGYSTCGTLYGNISLSFDDVTTSATFPECTFVVEVLDTSSTASGQIEVRFLNSEWTTPRAIRAKYDAVARNMNGYPNSAHLMAGGTTAYSFNGTHETYGGSDAPVINDFTKDLTCYYPGQAIVLESDVTGTVDDWTWEVYDGVDQLWTSSDLIETIVTAISLTSIFWFGVFSSYMDYKKDSDRKKIERIFKDKKW